MHDEDDYDAAAPDDCPCPTLRFLLLLANARASVCVRCVSVLSSVARVHPLLSFTLLAARGCQAGTPDSVLRLFSGRSAAGMPPASQSQTKTIHVYMQTTTTTTTSQRFASIRAGGGGPHAIYNLIVAGRSY